ncbi:restriction endonuclease subunit S [Enterobacter sp. OLF]|uniref:restriction endonuclease subunit S n=1 Tax=Enterobacter sp. OLF TaxID=1678677 RepID=UPI000D362D9E|nr:restriction endonuclease subunit S [Enterobacter sp. OLF]PUB50506.1 type I restriction modification DNA specificity domain protein [Enterobacter sp. OLF]
MSGLMPKEWILGKASDFVVSPKNDIVDGPFGSNLKASEYQLSGTPIIRLQNIKRLHFINKNIKYVSNEKAVELSRHSYKKGDIVITKLGDPLGLACIIPENFQGGIIVADLVRLRINDLAFDKRYLTYLLNSPLVISQLNKHIKGTTRSRINLGIIRDLNLPIASISEQKVIAEKLDTLLAQVDSTKARLEQIPQILKRFRQAVMKLAITGELTSEYRNNFPTNLVQEIAGIVEKERIEKKIKNSKLSKEPYPAKIPFSIPKSWQWYRLGHISLKITDGAHNTPKVLSEGYPYIMAKDLTKGKLDFSEERFISEKDHKELYFKCAPEVGDLLVVNIGAGTGNNVLIDSDIEFSFKNIAIIKKSKLITPTYLKIFFDSQKNRIFNEQTKGGAQPFLSLSVLNDIPFALPPLPEQHEIVRRVEQLFAYADTIEKQVNNALTRVNSLTQSILAKAFRGELTAQWRADNPSLISGENSAAALLERIKAERAASSGKKNSRKKA